MALAEEDIDLIRRLIQEECERGTVRYDLELRERLVRLEDELKHQRELLHAFMQQVDKRFEQVDKRFEQVDKRFEELLGYMNRRFEQVDKRFEQMDRRLLALEQRMDRFMRWSFAVTSGVGLIVVAALRLLSG